MFARQLALCVVAVAALSACQSDVVSLRRTAPLPVASPLPSATPTVAPSPAALSVTNEFPVTPPGPSSTPPALYGITAGPDGALWFTDLNNPYVGRLTTTGSLTTYPLANLQAGLFIHAESDGNLWFTAAQVNYGGSYYFASITTAGAVTNRGQLPGTNVGVNPIDFVPGPDGALWYPFYRQAGQLVGRITLAGSNTTYPYSASGSHFLFGVARGSDGALWYTDVNVPTALVRVATDGTSTTVPIPASAGDTPGGIAVGSDGAFWIAEGSKIARYTTGGAFTEYTIPSSATSSPQATNLCLGADGAIYFTEFGANRIGRITTAGVVTEYSVAPATASRTSTTACTVGPDGAIWFTESTGAIGRLG